MAEGFESCGIYWCQIMRRLSATFLPSHSSRKQNGQSLLEPPPRCAPHRPGLEGPSEPAPGWWLVLIKVAAHRVPEEHPRPWELPTYFTTQTPGGARPPARCVSHPWAAFPVVASRWCGRGRLAHLILEAEQRSPSDEELLQSWCGGRRLPATTWPSPLAGKQSLAWLTEDNTHLTRRCPPAAQGPRVAREAKVRVS